MAKLKKFPYKNLIAKTGTISGFLFENPNIDLPRMLFHEIHVPIAPLDLVGPDGKKRRTKTELQLEFIQLPQ